MAALKWDQPGEHFYETGISQGALYVQKVTGGVASWDTGVAWNGLISVSESPEGADEEAFYADNIKYLALRGVEDFGGSISAYQSPEEFDACDGTVEVVADSGVTIGQQPRIPFCLAYVTQQGNDSMGNEYGEILHIVYNATASPSEREYQTINDSPEPQELSWDFTTTPINVTGHKATSILKIHEKRANAAKYKLIKETLFGRDAVQDQSITELTPTLLTPDEIIAILQAQ